MRTLLAAAAAALALVVVPQGATASDAQFAPLDRPGPALSVPQDALRRSLACTGDLRRGRLDPVLLVPGTNVTPQEFSWNYARAFRAQGRTFCTVTLPVQSTGDVQVAGEHVVHALRTMHRAAGRRIDVVGHSQGGMVPRWALRFWPDTRRVVDDLVGFAPSNHGTVVSVASCTPGCPAAHRQQAVGSRFLQALNSRTETFAGVDYTSVYTRYDQVVVPNQDTASGSSSLRTGPGRRTNVATQDVCPTSTADHLSIGTYDPVAYALALDALDRPGPADPARVPAAVCAQALHPGVDPAGFPAGEAETLRLLATAYLVAETTTVEPPLARYVFASRRQGNRWLVPDADVLQELATRLEGAGWRLATAESVTAGLVANAAAQAPDASSWLRGGLVAWQPEVKQARLGVAPGPVVNAETAAQMARGAAELLGAEVAVSTTGVGGPDPSEGRPAGTVFVGVLVAGEVTTHELHLDGDPEDVCTGAAERALSLVVDRLRAAQG